MRTASICPTCATFYNTKCIIYEDILSTLELAPGTALDVILAAIDNKFASVETEITNVNSNLVVITNRFTPLTGTGAPSISATYIGQIYVDTSVSAFYVSSTVGNGILDWNLISTVPVTTTTTTTL